MRVKVVAVCSDGGTKVVKDIDSGDVYYVDNRISSSTKGKLYNLYPSDKDAKVIDTDFKIIE